MDWLAGPAPDVALRLLGCELLRTYDDGITARVRIIETEAYDQTDPASHSYKRDAARASAMFGPPGHAYVYLSYGIHYCFNIVCGPEGFGAGVLVRAVTAIEGVERIRTLRGNKPDRELLNGPGKVGQALAISPLLYGHNLKRPPLQLFEQPEIDSADIIVTRRIGISQAKDVPWRFVYNKTI